MSAKFQRAYLVQLPLPLAQLYSRAHNAKDARGQHDNTFYLFEALVKLAAAPLIAGYLHEVQRGIPRNEALDRLLAHLALPSLGQWLAMLRELARHFGQRPDAPSHPLGHLWQQLDARHRNRPALVALFRRIKNGPDGEPAGEQSCSLLQLFEGLVQYRNGVFGHGAGRFASFYEQEMGPLLFPAANEVLAEGMLNFLGPKGSRLVYLTEVSTVDEGRIEVSLRELVGLQGERLTPLVLPVEQGAPLVPNRVALLWPGQPLPIRLDPLLKYRESELAEEVLFLNRDRNGRQVEYLSYTTGRTERDRTTAPEMVALLSRVTGREVREEQLQALAEQSVAETPSVEVLLGEIAPPDRQLGDYEILAEIGRGGMGVVYLARQLSLGRLVALKMLPADLAGDEGALARFRREIRHLARCEHPNIVKVLSSGTLPDGRLHYTMEYVPGCDLEAVWRELSSSQRDGAGSDLGSSTWTQAVLTACHKQGSPAASSGQGSTSEPQVFPSAILDSLPEKDQTSGFARRVALLMRDAALALQAVHDQQLIHRDVKPSNLMLTPDGARVVLMDFGLAKGQSLALSASRAGGLLGTLRYAAPEQLAAATLTVGPRADVRGLGVTIWELLTRRRLFEDAQDERELAVRVHEVDVPRLRTIDPGLDVDLEAIVARATERRVGDRIRTARQLADYLQLYLEGKPLPIRPPSARELIQRWMVHRKALVGSVLLAGIVILLIAIAAFVLISSSRNTAVDALHKLEQAEKDRALAQVDALLVASPPAVPNIIEGLQPFRHWVDSYLRELRARPDLPEKRKTRVSLALLPVDAGEVSFLRERLLQEPDPQEMLLIRDLLTPYRTQLATSFWALVDDARENPEQKFRAVIALAAFDPFNQRWPDVGNRIMDSFLAANPLHLGLWMAALRPIRLSLLLPLVRVFHEGSRSNRSLVAANILADYAADRPDLLVNLVLDADARQFPVLFPRLQGHREAIPLLHEELAKMLHPDWKDPDLDPSWTKPESVLVQEIEHAQGMVADHFALCQDLQLDRFVAVAEGLRRSGYRPLCLRPYAEAGLPQSAGQHRVAAIWTRDGRDWQTALGLSADEIRQRDSDLQKQGYVPQDVAGYLLDRGDNNLIDQYAALWIKAENQQKNVRMVVGLPGSSGYTAAWQPLEQAGLLPRTQTQLDIQGQTLYSAIWEKPFRPFEVNLYNYGQDEAWYENCLSPSNFQVDVRLDQVPRVEGPREHSTQLLLQADKDLQRNPKDGKALLQRSQAHFWLGQYGLAVAEMTALIDSNPKDSGLYSFRAVAYARLGKFPEAEKDIAQFQKLNNAWISKAYLDGNLALCRGQEVQALKQLEETLAKNSRNPGLLFVAARLYARAAQTVQARALAGIGEGLLWRLVPLLLGMQESLARATSYGDRAIALLQLAVANGYSDYSRMQIEPDLEGLHSQPKFVDFLARDHLDRKYAAVFHDSATFESCESHGLEPVEHLKRARQLADQGWRPVALAVSQRVLGQPAVTASVWHRPVVSDGDEDALANRQAQAAVSLLELGQPESLWPLLRHRPAPRLRTFLIHRLAALGVDPQSLIRRLDEEAETSAQRALVLSLGEFNDAALPLEMRPPLVAKLIQTYRQDPDPGIHSAVDWLLRQCWGQGAELQKIDQELLGKPPGKRQWFINKEGQTMAVFQQPIDYLMGSPGSEEYRFPDETLHHRRIPRTFALDTRQVTVAQFQNFLADHPEVQHFHQKRYSPSPDGPVIGVTWYEAAEYCNWLSQQEGLPPDQWCYPPIPDLIRAERGEGGITMPADYLQRAGYRLPTEAEWEFACRAGARTSRFFGSSNEMLPYYLWFVHNTGDHAERGGQLKPNDFGLFDMGGNVREWTQDRYGTYPFWAAGRPVDDREDANPLLASSDRILRGASYRDHPADVRTAYRRPYSLAITSDHIGMRVAKTCP